MSLHVHTCNTDVSKIVHLMLTILVLGVSSLTLETDDIVIVQEDDSIMLNCTYRKDSMEYISNTDIRWQKQIGDKFEDIAAYSPPGGFKPFIVRDMCPFYDNRTKLIAPNTTLAAVLIIRDPSCSDVGTYRCWIRYTYPESLGKLKTSLSTFSFNARLPEKFMAFPDVLEENQSVSLVCSADVGSPWGNIKIWKISQYSDKPELIYTFNSTNNKTDNCTEYINVTTTYTVTKDDNGAIFRCSSQNNLTRGPGPSKDSQSISVLYAPFNTRINTSRRNYYVGENVDLMCISDGNPSPNYRWMFNLTEIVNSSKYSISGDKSKLSLTLNITDNGHYQCVASNKFGEQEFNSSYNVTLTVQEKNVDPSSSAIKSTCSRTSCLFIQSCTLRNGSAICSLNIWSVIALVFIALTVILGAASVSLILSRKPRKKINQTNGIGDVHISYTREKFEDFGGYADPKDVKRPENGPIKLDNPYADPVDFQTQYALVQKNWETPAKSSKDSSDTSNLLNNTDSSNTDNPSSSETANTKNSTNDEKTPGSTETSETIPKPPNVYDGAWV